MPSEQEQYRIFWARSRSLSTISDADGFFKALEAEVAAGRLTPSQEGTLRHSAFLTLSEATKDDPHAAAKIIEDYLAPHCLRENAEEGGGDTAISQHRLRELLRKWIEQCPEEQKWRTRFEVLRQACVEVDSRTARAPFWTIGAIGYRAPEVISTLAPIAEEDGRYGDEALNILASLGPPEPLRSSIVDKITARINQGDATRFDYAIQELASPAFLPHLFDRAGTDGRGRFSLSLLGRIADRAPGNQDLQARIWTEMREAADRVLDRRREMAFAGNAAQLCNSSDVVRTFLQWLSQPDDKKFRYLIYHRLEECYRPQQLRGWEESGSPEIMATLAEDASVPPGEPIAMRGADDYVIELAWHAAVSTGYRDVSEWLPRLVSAGSNPYVRGIATDIASCLVASRIPDYIKDRVTSSFDMKRGEDRPDFIEFVAAERVLRSSATPEAFEALLGCRFTYEGNVLRSTADAVAEVSVWLVRGGDVQTVAELFTSASGRDSSLAARSLAISGIRAIANAKLLSGSHIPSLGRLTREANLPSHLRERAIEALSSFSGGADAVVALEELDRLTASGQLPEEVSDSALAAIARLGGFESRPAEFIARLGLKASGGRYDVISPKEFDASQAFMLAVLFLRNSDDLGPAFRSVLRHGSDEVAIQLLAVSRGVGFVLSDALVDEIGPSIVDRILVANTEWSANTYLFQALRVIAPGLLLATPWEKRWADWLPDARHALAAEIEGATKSLAPSEAKRAWELLVLLLDDAHYAVRRAAARGLARVDMARLTGLCSMWAGAGPTGLRARAAEAAGWLTPDRPESIDNDVLRTLKTDPEPSVREAAVRAEREGRRRAWAAEFVSHVGVANSDRNIWVLDAYKYGRALSQVGDDDSIRTLEALSASEAIPPNVRHWILQTRKAVEKQWNKTTRDWPQPWLPWSGSIEEIDGIAEVDGQTLHVHFSLWLRHRSARSEVSSWGGAFWGTDEGNTWGLLGSESHFVLKLPGRREARALMTIWGSDGHAQFSGNGPYPSPVVD